MTNNAIIPVSVYISTMLVVSGCTGSIVFAAEKTGESALESTDGKADRAQSDDTKRTILRHAYPVLFAGLTIGYASLGWTGGTGTDWRWARDGFFGHATRFGGFDKAIRLFSHYTAMRLSCTVFNYTERGSNYRFLYGGLLTMLLGLSIEIGDAYSGSGFSYYDLLSDATGMLIAGFLSFFPKVEAFISLSLEYWPSAYFRKHPEKAPLIFNDFSGMIVMANLKLAGFGEAGLDIPNFLRYVMIDIGYGTRGYTPYDRRAAWTHYGFPVRSQNIYVGISINIAEVIADLFKNPQGMACRAIRTIVKTYHPPAGYKHRVPLRESRKLPR